MNLMFQRKGVISSSGNRLSASQEGISSVALVKGVAGKLHIVWLGSELLPADRREYRPREQGVDVVRSCRSKEATVCTYFSLLKLLGYVVEDSQSGLHS
jgi:hypothetical protein